MKTKFGFILRLIGGIAIMALFVAAIMWLWNALMPAITGWSAIGYWQALGLAVLFRLLTGHFGSHMMHRFPGRRHRRFHERMRRMPREERKEFIRRQLNKMESDTAGDEE